MDMRVDRHFMHKLMYKFVAVCETVTRIIYFMYNIYTVFIDAGIPKLDLVFQLRLTAVSALSKIVGQ